MRFLRAVLVSFICIASALPANAAPTVYYGSVNASTQSGAYVYVGSCGTSSVASGQICTTSSAPPTNSCAVGALALNTSTGNSYVCTAANTWSLEVIAAGSGLTSGNCVTASGSATLSTGSGPCVYTNAANTFTANQTINAVTTLQANGMGSLLDHNLKLNNVASTKADSADSTYEIDAYAANLNTACSSGQPTAKIWPGVSGATAANYGGYWVFWTKNDGACTGWEVLVMTPGGHLYPAGPTINTGSSTAGCNGTDSQGICQITTPSSCSAGAACGTVTVVFGNPFYQTNGTTAEQPYCFFTTQDTNLTTNAWVPVPETVAYNQFVLGYAPLVAQATARTLNLYWRCNASSY